MTRPVANAILLLSLALALSACATTPAPVASTPTPAPPSARAKALVLDRFILTGQPSADDLAAWRAEGVHTVVNLRTPAEIADRAVVPYDEAALAAELGLAYIEHPIGGADHPYGPEVLAAFAATVDAAEGPILLHCGVGARAGLLHAAYAVRYLGKSPDAAMRELEPLGLWPLPLERLTGQRLRLVSD